MAFEGCVGLQELTLPESLERIEGGGIIAGSGVRSIRFPARATDIRYDCLGNTKELEKIEYAVFPKQGTEFIKKQQYDDYIILFNTCKTIRMYVYHIIGNEYTECFEESVNCGSAQAQQLYSEWMEHFHWMKTNDCALRAYRYEHGELVEVREIDRASYDSRVYVSCGNELIMRKEFGMEPQSPEWKAKFAENLTKAEQFMQMLTFACYVNDTAVIIERAKTAQCENYSSKNTVRRGLRNAITQHCSNHRQLQEA